MTDYISCVYGQASIYGIFTKTMGVREGINIMLNGYIPTENVRFRKEPLQFKLSIDYDVTEQSSTIKYPAMTKSYNNFQLKVSEEFFDLSRVTVLLGQNGTGKTTFIRLLLAGKLRPDNDVALPSLKVSYKPQQLSNKFEGTVQQFLNKHIGQILHNPEFNVNVIRSLQIENLMDNEMQILSGGELQRLAIVLCLGTPADIYLIDEPSAFLDFEQRVNVSKVLKRFFLQSKTTAFIVEHDFMMATFLADQVILFRGSPGHQCEASTPSGMITGINSFLRQLGVTFRKDPTTFRPRINKLNSTKDIEQTHSGNYFYA